MKKYLFIASGGFIGAILRYVLEGVETYRFYGILPINTLLINIAGSFTLSVIMNASFRTRKFESGLIPGISTGFLGAFTTFSTVCRETAGLITNGAYLAAASYILFSALLGLLAAYCGMAAYRSVETRYSRRNTEGGVE